MWTIFKVFIEFVAILLLFYVLVFWLRGMWKSLLPDQDQTLTPCIGRWSLNHWTTREVPTEGILDLGFLSESPEELLKILVARPHCQRPWGLDPGTSVRTTSAYSIASICENIGRNLLYENYASINLLSWNICIHWNFWHPPWRIFWLSNALGSEDKAHSWKKQCFTHSVNI